jgi:hypothetical protein
MPKDNSGAHSIAFTGVIDIFILLHYRHNERRIPFRHYVNPGTEGVSALKELHIVPE